MCEQKMIHTGVAWCELEVDEGLLALVREIRANERLIREALEDADLESIVRATVVDGVRAAESLAQDADITTETLFDRCFHMTGKPWSQAPNRRDMRERIRVYRALSQCVSVPTDADGLLDLWMRAMDGEVAYYSDCEVARFRTHGTPFGHGDDPFGDYPPPCGAETVDAIDIPREIDALLEFAHRGDIPAEIRAGAAHYLHGHIHPFRDGNGHTGRMLGCLILAPAYTDATIVAFVRRVQLDRPTMFDAMKKATRMRRGISAVVLLFLEYLRAAQGDVLAELATVRLPLERVSAQGCTLLGAGRKNRAVYLMRDGRVLKQVAAKGRLTRAIGVFDSMQAAYDAGAPIARPFGLVDIENGYAVVLERVSGQTLGELVSQGVMSPREAGSQAARCLHVLHAIRVESARLRDVRAIMVSMIEETDTWLPSDVMHALLDLVGRVPATTSLLHCDAHAGNVMLDETGATLIDADSICVGHPVFELGFARSSLICEAEVDLKRAERFLGISATEARDIWQRLLADYLSGWDDGEIQAIDRAAELVAWVALIGRLTRGAADDTTSGAQFLRMAQAIGRVSALVEEVGRLDFDQSRLHASQPAQAIPSSSKSLSS